MGYRTSQFNVPHSFSSNFSQSHLNTALLADDTAMFETLVLPTQALIILYRAKYFGAKKAIPFGLKSSVIDGLRFLYFTIGPGPNQFR